MTIDLGCYAQQTRCPPSPLVGEGAEYAKRARRVRGVCSKPARCNPSPGSHLRFAPMLATLSTRGEGDSSSRHQPVTNRSRPLGLVLAGGLARRMGGGDKARIRIGDRTILERVLARIAPQCSAVIINANGDPARFADTGLPVVANSVPDFAGPLAGILAGSTGRRRMRPTLPTS